jgi:AcrR family transcriptional regulator
MIHKTEPVGRRERKREVQRDRIAETALRLAVEEGLEALTIARLALELDAAVGALYRYFPSKDALLAELQRRAIGGFADLLRHELAEAKAEGWPAGAAGGLAPIVLAARLYWQMPLRAPAHFHLICLLVGDPRDLLPEELAAPNLALAFELLADVRALLEAAAASGALEAGGAARRAVQLWASLQGLMQLRKLARFERELFGATELFAELTGSLLRGWGALPDTLEAAFEWTARFTGRPRPDERNEGS